MAKQPKRTPPQASRTIEGLRDTGYESTTALADVVDNSIAAKASKIDIEFVFNPLGDLVLFVSDNGEGMSEDKLDDAMTYGSTERGDPASLGKFGLGMKTASTSMARCLTVTTRNEAGVGPFSAQWDLDFVAEENDWLLRYPEENEILEEIQRLENISEGGSGTVVSWRKIDRLLRREYKTEAGKLNDFNRQTQSLIESLQLTYHKFLETNNGVEDIEIYFNSDKLEPWDPFGIGLSEKVIGKVIPVRSDEANQQMAGSISVKCYVFPPISDLTEEQAKQFAIGNNRRTTGTALGHQGIYVYRHNRLITYGNWLTIRSPEMHQNLHRIDFSFDHHLDDLFSLDIKKSKITLHQDITDYVGNVIAPAVHEADSRYRNNQRKKAVLEGGQKHEASNTIVEKHAEQFSSDITMDPGPEENDVTVTNNNGKIRIGMGVDDSPGEPHVLAAEEMYEPYVLWEPFLNKATKNQAVKIHVGHEFYRRVYGNLEQGLGIQALDSFLWALMQAELKVIHSNNRNVVRSLRIEVSRILHEISLHNFNEPLSE